MPMFGEFERLTGEPENVEWCTTCQRVAVPACTDQANVRCQVIDVLNDLVELKCYRCGRPHHVHSETVRRFPHDRIACLPCTFPERWVWVKDPELLTWGLVEREAPRKQRKPAHGDLRRPGEAEADLLEALKLRLMAARTRLPDLRERRARLDELIAQAEEESKHLPDEIKAMEQVVSSLMNDPQRERKHEANQVKELIHRAEQRIAKEEAEKQLRAKRYAKKAGVL